MPFKSDEIRELKNIIKDTIMKLLTEEDFLSALLDKVLDKAKFTMPEEVRESIEVQGKQIGELQRENEALRKRVDNSEQYSRRCNLRVVGLPEDNNMDIELRIQQLLNDELKLKNQNNQGILIRECYRVGKQTNSGRPRQVMVKLADYTDKMLIMKTRRQLKGTGIVIVEDLTRIKYDLLKSAQEELGRKTVWSMDGNIYARVKRDKYRITSGKDVSEIKLRINNS